MKAKLDLQLDGHLQPSVPPAHSFLVYSQFQNICGSLGRGGALQTRSLQQWQESCTPSREGVDRAIERKKVFFFQSGPGQVGSHRPGSTIGVSPASPLETGRRGGLREARPNLQART